MWVKSSIIRDAEFDDVIRFDIDSRTSVLNRKLSVFTDFEAISSNFCRTLKSSLTFKKESRHGRLLENMISGYVELEEIIFSAISSLAQL